MMIEKKPFIRADDWLYIMKKGVRVYAMQPHIINQDWSGRFASTLKEHKIYFKGNPIMRYRMHLCRIKREVYKVAGFYEEV